MGAFGFLFLGSYTFLFFFSIKKIPCGPQEAAMISFSPSLVIANALAPNPAWVAPNPAFVA